MLYQSHIETPVGLMAAVADAHYLYMLDFMDSKHLISKLKNLEVACQSSISMGTTQPLKMIESELAAYFKGDLRAFHTPHRTQGTSFQKRVWSALMAIPYGQTQSYEEQARHMGESTTAVRAVANANGRNPLAILIPCHRVVRKNGDLGGYAGGVDVKKQLLEHEKN